MTALTKKKPSGRGPRKRNEQCPVVYAGPSYPRLRGTRCIIGHHPHPNVRHYARVGTHPLMWWTEQEKAALRSQP